MNLFQAGRLKHFVKEWEKLTTDPEILDVVEHCHIQFIDNNPPQQNRNEKSFQVKFNKKEEEIIDAEIKQLLEKSVIREVEYQEGQFLSPIFVRPKKNGEYRMILNLKSLNEYISYNHLKMDSFDTVLTMVKQN